MSDSMQTLNDHTQSEYKYGWSTQMDMDILPHGLTEGYRSLDQRPEGRT
jgi:Fe-S cluster assembly protein SufB